MKVKFLNLSEPTKLVKEEFLKKLETFLDRANFILTDEVSEFESEWASYIGAKYAIGVSNGADALWLALKSLGIKEGDEVITQGNAYNASVTAIIRAGAIPRYVDIDPKTLLIDPNKIDSLINSKTKAILPVHLFGQASDMSAITEIAKKHNLLVVEDCAQAHGAHWKGKKVGSWGDAAGWSFYPTKNLGAFGDAGAVTTSSEQAKDQVRILRNLGQTSKNNHTHLGYNMRLDPIQAIVLSLKLKYLDDATKARQLAASRYNKLINETQLPVEYVHCDPNATHSYHLYPIKILKGDRNQVCEEIKKLEIDTMIHYPQLVIDQPFYPKKLPRDICPIAEESVRSIVSLPLHENITEEEQWYVVNSLKKVLA